MTVIDTATSLAAVDAALAGLSGVNAALGQEIRDELAKLGAQLSAHWTSAIDDAKGAWIAGATAVAAQALEAADYAYGEAGEPAPPALTFNPYDSTAIAQRLTAAAALVAGNVFLVEALGKHSSAFSSAFAGARIDAAHAYVKGPRDHIERLSWSTSPAQVERAAYVQIQRATAWLAFIA